MPIADGGEERLDHEVGGATRVLSQNWTSVSEEAVATLALRQLLAATLALEDSTAV